MRLSLRAKLLLGFGSVLALFGVVGFIAIRGMAFMDDETADITGNRLPALFHAEEANVELLLVREHLLALALEPDRAKRDAEAASQQKAAKAFDEQLAALKHAHLTTDEQRLVSEIEKTRSSMKASEPRIVAALTAGDVASAAPLIVPWRAEGDKIHDLFEELVVQIEHDADEESAQAHDTYLEVRTITIGTIVAALVLGIAIAVFLSQRIVGNVRRVGAAARLMAREDLPALVEVAQALADGDLTRDAAIAVQRIQVTSGDEIGTMGADVNQMIDALQAVGAAFAEMNAGLRNAVGQVQVAATGLSGASGQLGQAAGMSGQAVQQVTAAMQEIAAGAQDQASNAQQTGLNVQQLLDVIEQVARGAQEQARTVAHASDTAIELVDGVEEMAAHAQSIATASQQAQTTVGEGAKAVEQTVQQMREIHQVVSEAAGRVEELGQLGERIGAVVETIDDIAEQTNLLALNAAIEAARAGEQGRGFAIVADEVRKLAERSQRETKAIAELIQEVQTGTQSAVTAMDQGARKVEAGSAQADRAGQALTEILQAIGATVGQIQAIASAAQQISARGRDVGEAMRGIAAGVEEATAATEEMAASANEAGASVKSIAATSEQSSAAIEEISASAEEMSAQVEEVTAQAEEMAATADELRALAGRFRLPDAEGGLNTASPIDLRYAADRSRGTRSMDVRRPA